MTRPATIIEAPSWKGVPPIGERFGKRLKQIRTERGYTQLRLSCIAGPDRSFISDMERGLKVPTLLTIEQFATTFGITISELMEGV